MSIQNADQLIWDIEYKIDAWNERSMFTLGGVKNLSMSDLDTLRLYAEQHIGNGGQGFIGLMKPLGAIADVLGKYGVV